MPYADLPAFLVELRQRPEISARALEFQILTACRPAEVLGARWDEIDGALWTLPATRMKGGEQHRGAKLPRYLHRDALDPVRPGVHRERERFEKGAAQLMRHPGRGVHDHAQHGQATHAGPVCPLTEVKRLSMLRRGNACF